MNFPLQVSFKDMASSDFIYNNIWDHAEKLERFYDRIVSCYVTVSSPHRHHKKGKLFQVQVRLYLPGTDIFVSTEAENNHAHEDVYVAIRDAFDSVRRRLEDHIRKQRGIVKDHQAPSRGKVVRLFPNEGFGFLETPDHREVYFHENSVLYQDFKNLNIGDDVRFTEELGEKGPQVTSMTVIKEISPSLSL